MEVNEPDIVDWQTPEVSRWIDSVTRLGTKYVYKSAFRAYTRFTELSPEQLIDEGIEDAKLDPRHRRDVVMKRLVDFYGWLKKDYPIMSRGANKHTVLSHGVSDKLAHVYVNSVRSFYATFGITIRMKGRHKLPKARTKNKRMIVSAEQVKVLVDNARNLRDKAFILTLFQSGMDVSTLCSLRYGDVAEGLAKGEYPLKIDLQRPKTGIEYYSFLGRDAIDALKIYLADMKTRGIVFKNDTPLFHTERGRRPLDTNLVQNAMKHTAERSGFVDHENNGNSFNPLGPHSLRESFGSIMTNSGVPDTIVDFWLGHEIGEMGEAYKSVQFESLKKMYLERERLITIAPKTNTEEITEKVKAELSQQSQQLQQSFNTLVYENLDLKTRVSKAEKESQELKKRMLNLEGEFQELKQLIQQAKEIAK